MSENVESRAAGPQDRGEAEPPSRLRWLGGLFAPVAAAAVWWAMPEATEGLPPEARNTAAIGVLMAILWMTEALPLPVTSLLPLIAFPLAGVTDTAEAAAPYASDVVFLFLGGFLLALGMERWGLHRRIALHIVARVGTRPTRIVIGFMAATGFLSMWISNTAATMMMLPIGLSIATLLIERPGASPGEQSVRRRFATGLMLAIAYAASIGSLSTLIGTPPNLFLRGFLSSSYGIELGFGEWMRLGLPLSVALMATAYAVLRKTAFRGALPDVEGGREIVKNELARLGPPNRGEKIVAWVFCLTVLAWLLRGPLAGSEAVAAALPWVTRVSDPSIAVAAAVALFAIPVDLRRGVFALDWKSAERIPWAILLLFGGGLSLAAAVRRSGLDGWIGQQVAGAEALPTWLLVLLVAGVVLVLTELTSNTATAATFLPVLAGTADGLGIAPLALLLPATLAASCAFMLPVATPPNAIVFGSGHVTMRQMASAGVWLNLISLVIVTAASLWLAPWALEAR